jgi:hypothetical protein
MHELVNRATNRLVYLEKEAEVIYRSREPDPEKGEEANPALMGAVALTLRTAAYKYPDFSFSPSIAPQSWFWRNIIPYEASFDFIEGDALVVWQPTWHFAPLNAGLRLGFGFTGGVFESNKNERRENYGLLGLDLMKLESMSVLSGWGITPAVYHQWIEPEEGDQTSFGLEAHVDFLKNRLRVSFGARDIIHEPGQTLFFRLGIADLPGLVYWMSR